MGTGIFANHCTFSKDLSFSLVCWRSLLLPWFSQQKAYNLQKALSSTILARKVKVSNEVIRTPSLHTGDEWLLLWKPIPQTFTQTHPISWQYNADIDTKRVWYKSYASQYEDPENPIAVGYQMSATHMPTQSEQKPRIVKLHRIEWLFDYFIWFPLSKTAPPTATFSQIARHTFIFWTWSRRRNCTSQSRTVRCNFRGPHIYQDKKMPRNSVTQTRCDGHCQ